MVANLQLSAPPSFDQLAQIATALAAGRRLYPDLIDDAGINSAVLKLALNHFPFDNCAALKVQEVYEELTPAIQYHLGLRSAPGAVARIFAACVVRARFGDQSGHLAPLWNDGDGMKIDTPSHGLIMPVVRGGLVRAWLHYKQATDRAPRWVSSSHLPNGSKVRPSIHVVQAEYAERSGVCLLTAHALEAEDAARDYHVSTVGLNGVMPSALLAQLQAEWPELRGVTICLNEVSPFLLRALQSAGLKARLA